MTIAEKTFNGVDLGEYGLVTPAVSGIFDLAAEEVARVFTDGRDIPHDTMKRASLVPVAWSCVVEGDDHAALRDKLTVLRALLSPRLGWCPMTVENRAGQQTMARCLGFPVKIDALPYGASVVEFELQFERYPWWEDATPQTVSVTTSPQTINNTGALPAYPVYTCTATQTLAAGLSFSVGSGFAYNGALADEDVLVVTTDLPDVTVNGVRDFAHTHPDSAFPTLVPGENSVVKLTSGYSLGVAYRRRWE